MVDDRLKLRFPSQSRVVCVCSFFSCFLYNSNFVHACCSLQIVKLQELREQDVTYAHNYSELCVKLLGAIEALAKMQLAFMLDASTKLEALDQSIDALDKKLHRVRTCSLGALPSLSLKYASFV